MKKIWKTFLAAASMSIAVCLCTGMKAFAEEIQGEFEENPAVFWKIDTDTKTMTFYGDGALPDISNLENIIQNVAGLSADDVQHVVIGDGITSAFGLSFGLIDRTLTLGKDLKIIPTRIYQAASVSLSEENPYLNLYDGCLYTEDYTEMLYCPRNRETITLHPDVQKLERNNLYQNGDITISSDSEYFSMYEGCLYTKDYSELIHCPVYRPGQVFHPNLQIIGRYAFYSIEDTKTVTVPWGVTTLRPYALNGIFGYDLSVALPDTLATVEMDDPMDGLVIYRDVQVLYSDRNQEMIRLRGMPTEEQLKAWAACYPGQTAQPEPSAPAESVPQPEPSEPAEPLKPAESSNPVEPSKPAESPAPAESSEPVQPAFKPESQFQAESSSAPESVPEKPDSESSAEPSVPESSAGETSAESSTAPQSDSEPAAESAGESSEEVSQAAAPDAEKSGGRFGWMAPVIAGLIAVAAAAAAALIRLLKK